MADLSQYGTVTPASGSPAVTGVLDLSKYGSVAGGSGPASTPTEFFQTLRDHLWPSAVGVVKKTIDAYRNMGPQSDTLSPGHGDPRIPPDAPFYGYKKALLDLEDAAKSIYDKVTHPASTIANDPIGVAADFGKLVSSIRIAKDRAEGNPATEIHPVDKALDTAGNVIDTPAGKGVMAAVKETTNLPIAKSVKVGVRAYRQAQTQQAIDKLPTIPNPTEDASAVPAAAPTPAPSSIPEGVDPALWEKLPPAMQEALRQKVVGQPTPQAAKPTPGKVEPIEWRTPEEIAAASKPAPTPEPVKATPVVETPQPVESKAPPSAWLPPEELDNAKTTGLPPEKHMANRAAMAQRFVEKIGGTQNLPTNQSEWARLADDLGERVPSKETQAQIEFGLNRRMVTKTETAGTEASTPSAVSRNPKALKIAQKLQAEMESSGTATKEVPSMPVSVKGTAADIKSVGPTVPGIGATVTLKNGKTVIVKELHPDGTFDYE